MKLHEVTDQDPRGTRPQVVQSKLQSEVDGLASQVRGLKADVQRLQQTMASLIRRLGPAKE